jgi:hypothetical protein
MAKSPCIGCEFELADKNNPTCRECDRRVEYVALIAGGGSIMEETKETEVGDQRSEVRGTKKECIIEGCEKKAHARELCHSDYKRWRDGDIEHPTLGKFFKIRGVNKKKLKVKKTAAAVAEKVTEGVKANLLGALKVDLGNYPRIKHQIDFLADKYLVNPEHVIIGLIGEALAGRRERSDRD